jgi:sec-independent protein translocase protein TatC
MTVVEHLEELRHRMFISALAFVVGSIIAYIFYAHILHVLKLPLDHGGRIAGIKVDLSVQGVTTAFLIKIKISLFAGFLIALPVILWQLWRFITPGLEPGEKRYAIPFVVGSVGLFMAGAVVAYFVLPQALGFLLHFARGFHAVIFFDQYVGFVAFMILAFGITFEIPMVLIILAAAGVVTSAWLSRHRKHAILLAFIIGAVATPSQDPYSNTLMAVPLYVMYEGALLIIRFGMKK